MKIKLTDNTEMLPILVTGGPRYIQGANRDTLSFVFPDWTALAYLDEMFTAENCENITIVNDEDNSENIYKGYTIRVELTKSSVEVGPATPDAEATYEDRVTVTMAQRTYAENQLAQLQAAVATLTQE